MAGIELTSRSPGVPCLEAGTATIDSTVLARSNHSGPIRFRYAAESESLSRRQARADAEEGVPVAAHGLLDNLIARAMEPGTDCVARYGVIAGGRRLAAMQALAAEGTLDEDHLVPCRMIGAIVAAEEVSRSGLVSSFLDSGA